jgi:hypothetical protein
LGHAGDEPKRDQRSPPLWADGGLLLDALPIPAAIVECDTGEAAHFGA